MANSLNSWMKLMDDSFSKVREKLEGRAGRKPDDRVDHDKGRITGASGVFSMGIPSYGRIC
jgi:hypothetical protein